MKVVTPSPEECRNLFNTDPNTFHVECCLKAGAGIHLRDHRCTLKKLLEKAEAGKKGSVGDREFYIFSSNTYSMTRLPRIIQMTFLIRSCLKRTSVIWARLLMS